MQNLKCRKKQLVFNWSEETENVKKYNFTSNISTTVISDKNKSWCDSVGPQDFKKDPDVCEKDDCLGVLSDN